MPSPVGTKRINLEPKDLAAFRAALIAWRAKKGMTRRSMVEGLDISVQQLANLEYGLQGPSERVYLALCAKIGMKPAVTN
jgi:transcriptional regulator with XRE-family HTH domain